MKQVNDIIGDKLRLIWRKSGAEICATCKSEVYYKIIKNTLLKANLETFYELLIKITKT